MTRISGTEIVMAPCCGRHYSTPLYASINFSAFEYWTDGAASASLAPRDGGLRQCSCGCYFLLRDTVTIKRVFEKREVPPEPIPLRTRLIRRWLTFLDRKPAVSAPAVSAPALKPPELEPPVQPPEELPPRSESVSDTELPQVIAGCGENQALEIVARRRHWQALNNPYRAVYRAHKESGAKDFPPFAPTDEQRLNMAALLGLLLYRPGASATEISELHREMGDLQAASSAIAGAPQDSVAASVIRQCIAEGLTGPVRYRG